MAKSEIKGLPELRRKLGLVELLTARGVRKAIEDQVDASADDLRAQTPVKTGFMRESEQAEVAKDGFSGQVAITAEYAKYVVHGTSDTEANDFVAPVIERTRAGFPARVSTRVKVELREITKP